jgi:hypothetical protein
MCFIREIVLSGSGDGATGFCGAIIGIEECRDSICSSYIGSVAELRLNRLKDLLWGQDDDGFIRQGLSSHYLVSPVMAVVSGGDVAVPYPDQPTEP